MATDQIIEPFPGDIDRTAFGHWLSGFVDGDGALCLGLRRYTDCKAETPLASLVVKLRGDDEPVLRLIQSFLRCGRVTRHAAVRRSHSDSKPSACLTIKRPADLAEHVLAHFSAFPLRSKKRFDLAHWSEGVKLCNAVCQRPLTGRRGLNGGGTMTRWREDEHCRFTDAMKALRLQREYRPPPAQQSFDFEAGFAPWLSGFTDAEGCFQLLTRKAADQNELRLEAMFSLKLRADDLLILQRIRSFLDCGGLVSTRSPRTTNPQVLLQITRVPHLAGILVPHFDANPLFAKKKADYAIWREGVLLMEQVGQRPQVSRRLIGGGLSKWLPEERSRFLHLATLLKSQRAYVTD